MCGILLSTVDGPFSHRSLQSLRRRGPDEIGFWLDQNIRIGHTRLAIIGLDERGSQPMENDRHVIAFNGEIYNFLEIKRRLERAGLRVSGTSDTEVLLHAWTLWGAAMLTDLTGFWAFAVYDKETHRLTLVRDQFGIKPLYYYNHDGCVMASSMIRTIVDTIDRSLTLDYRALSEYVRYQFTFEDRTFFREIRKVLPGQIVEIDLGTGQSTARIYEDILAASPDVRQASDEWLRETQELLRTSVVESTISDTSFTCFCSGGIDSSLITRLANPEIAYHANYSDPECNETFFARQVTEDTNIRLFVVNAREDLNLVDSLRQIVDDFDEPSIGSVILPLDDLLAQVRRRYKVILTGTGGDELFAGYMRFQLVLGQCQQDSYKELFTKLKRIKDPVDRFEVTHHKGETSYYRFYQPDAQQSFRNAFEVCRTNGDMLGAMLQFDRRHFLQGLLNIDDKMCARHSLESRPSFLHQNFVRHLMRLDSHSLFNGGDLKPLLRKLADGILPPSVVRRTDKMGFTTPIGTFVNRASHLIREQLEDSPFRDHYNLKGLQLHAESKFSREVFGLIMLDLWLNRYAHPA